MANARSAQPPPLRRRPGAAGARRARRGAGVPLSPADARRCAITGAAAGIGRALAFELGRGGAEILGVDVDGAGAERTRAELERAGIRARFVVADLATPEGVEEALGALLAARPLELVAHCAGDSAVAPFERSDLAAARRLVDLNLLAPIRLSTGLVAGGAMTRGGSLVFVASLSCYVGYPGAAVYAATKDGLASFAAGLRVSLSRRGVAVLTVFPGPTRTEHARRHAPPGASAAAEARRMPPDELAGRIAAALRRRRRVLVPGARNRAFAVLGRAFPRLAERAMRRAMLEPLERAARG